MTILTPGCQDAGEFALARADNHAVAIVGTAERMCVTYPIRASRNDDGSFSWDYTGDSSTEYDETAEVETTDAGELLFQDENGNDVPASMVAVLAQDDDGEWHEVGRLGAEPAPVARSAIALPALDGAELATIFAALRFYQQKGQGDPANRSDAIHELATTGPGGVEVISLDAAGIDRLCERLNFVEETLDHA